MEGVEVVRAFTRTSTETPFFFLLLPRLRRSLFLLLFLFCRLRFYIFFPSFESRACCREGVSVLMRLFAFFFFL